MAEVSEKKVKRVKLMMPCNDDPNVDHWKIEKFDPAWNPTGMLEVSSFSTLFPQYREKYIQDCWPQVKSALKKYGISCKLNLLEGSMTVSTTWETRDPYIIIKARDLIRLLSRSVPVSREKFIRRRQRLVGPNSSTLKALEILTSCYILVQGVTVAVMGSHKGLEQIRRIVEECMRIENIYRRHPVYNIIKILMMKKELERNLALAN